MIVDPATGQELTNLVTSLTLEERGAHDRPWVMTNMVTSIDGATAVEGGATPLSDDDDRALFRALRAIADVIVVGAGTVRAENYRPARPVEEFVDGRRTRGQEPAPQMVVVSGSLALDPETRLFADPDHRPTVIGSATADEAKAAALAEVADLVLLDEVTGRNVLSTISVGAVVLCEGGPTLNGRFLTEGLIDEVHWTVAPMMVGGGSKRMVDGPVLETPATFQLTRVWAGDRALFLRYLRS